MAGQMTAERGERQQLESGPPRSPRVHRRRMLIILFLAVVLTGGGSIWLLYGSRGCVWSAFPSRGRTC